MPHLRSAGGIAAGCGVAGRASTASANAPDGKIQLAAIGVGGKGWSDVTAFAAHPQVAIAALCDVDAGRMHQAAHKFPQARCYQDWRELLAKEGDKIGAVSVSTPDHMHAPIAMSAVNRVYAWSNKPTSKYRPTGPRPAGEDPVPATLDRDGWLGTAPARPYKAGVYHPTWWRGWQDFGVGWLGDMGCHIVNTPFQALKLTAPLSIRAEVGPAWWAAPARRAETWPTWQILHYTFQGTELTAGNTLELTWSETATSTRPTRKQLWNHWRGLFLALGGRTCVAAAADRLPPCQFWTWPCPSTLPPRVGALSVSRGLARGVGFVSILREDSARGHEGSMRVIATLGSAGIAGEETAQLITRQRLMPSL